MEIFSRRLLLPALALCLFGVSSPAGVLAQSGTAGKAVLVTSASSGIGLRVTEVLAANGYYVYAGARKAEDLASLSTMANVEGIRLDVTVQEEIDAAVETVMAGGRGLYGLVNNAGVAIVGPLIEVPVDDLNWLLDVNLVGPYRVTQAFAPLIIETQGRITTTGSISGILSGAFLGHYSMSKHAVEAFTDALAAEMAGFGVEVSVMEPGNYKSDIAASMRARMEAAGYGTEGSLFAKQMDGLFAGPTDRSQYKEPDDVAQAVLHFLSDASPKRRYMVVPNQREADITIRKAIQELVELNEGHPFSYDRDALIRMLDEAMGSSGR